jgi:phosphopantetheinyl transferase
MEDHNYRMLPTQKANIRSPQTEPIDPFEGTGFLSYPACRLATNVEPDAPEQRKLFSPEELARLERMKSPQRREEMAASFSLRRNLIGDLINCAPDTVKLVTESDGAPKLENPPGWSLSIANKGGATVVAIDPAPANIGVDLELVRALDWNAMLSMATAKKPFSGSGRSKRLF